MGIGRCRQDGRRSWIECPQVLGFSGVGLGPNLEIHPSMRNRMLIQLVVLMTGFSLMAEAAPRVPASVAIRLNHAKELLGGSYKKKVLKANESASELTGFVTATTRKFLPKAHQKEAQGIAKAILEASSEFELDPVFLMAVIQNESSFNPRRKGGVGEIGLMQIRPSTAAWIAGLYGIEYEGEDSLYDAETNVWIGAALLDKLRNQFDSSSRLYLSAYNLGPKKLRQMLKENKKPKEYVQAVMKRYIALYSGFKMKGDSKLQSAIAWKNTLNLTRKLARN
jgi:soluble lytic murein transglycosylase